jgi:hypothetical protein
MMTYADDREEIERIGYQLQQRQLYGAAQLVFQLARERDEARQQSGIKPDADKSLAPSLKKSLLPNNLEEMARALNLMNNDECD